ncbi:MAG TPA: NAD(P)-dependent oxidoreductase, partial [Aequorivita sp.]|nr:NAD(P)-dependent oxidoreductase [Aequorivita sp.]
KAEYYIQKAKELGLEAPTFAEAVSNETFKQVDSVNLKSVLDYSFRTSI